MLVRVTNTSAGPSSRHWAWIPDPATGNPLTLRPGESADDIELPDDFEDPHLLIETQPPPPPPVITPVVPNPPAADEPAASTEE